MNRKLISQIATLHCAATDWSASNLKNEGTPANSILVSGNPGIDALQMVAEALNTGRRPRNPSRFDQTKKLILVTAHRRENFGRPLARICKAVKQIAARPDVEVVWPLHPNPNVRRTVRNTLAGGTENLHLIEPLDYLSFVDLMMQSYILLTDSGGIQEEGCCLGRPVLVLRSKTERPEALLAGTNMLVSTDVRAIVGAVARLLDDATHYGLMAKVCSIYGDGQASARIAQRIVSEFGLKTFESERAVAAASQLRDRMARFDAGDRKSAS
jgi:UDP-N-acetylglucosamine 2-epimerase